MVTSENENDKIEVTRKPIRNHGFLNNGSLYYKLFTDLKFNAEKVLEIVVLRRRCEHFFLSAK